MIGSQSIPKEASTLPLSTLLPSQNLNKLITLITHVITISTSLPMPVIVTTASYSIPSYASAIEGWQIAIARNHRGATQRKIHLTTTGQVEHTSRCALVTTAHVASAHDLP